MGYLKVLENVEKAKKRSGRENEKIELIAVSKQHTLDEIHQIYQLGCRDFGESRIPEALEKIPLAPQDIRWHFIGPLQKNKVNKAVGRFTLIHSIDTFELAAKIDKTQSETSILLQVNTSGESTKQGLSPEGWKPHLDALFQFKHLKIKGLMTMAPLTDDTQWIRSTFRKLREFQDELKLPILSMGMSHDYEIAIEEGATMLRIGTAIFT